MTRSQDEIVERIENRRGEDILGFEVGEYVHYLDYEHAKSYLDDKVTEEKWKEATQDLKPPKETMIDYMEFAWEKANDGRGISANRSLMHYQAWLWLDGDEILWPTLFDNYRYYGKEALIRVCQYLGIDSTQWDDGQRNNA